MTERSAEHAMETDGLTPTRYSVLPAGVAAGAVAAYAGTAPEVPLGPEGADGDAD